MANHIVVRKERGNAMSEGIDLMAERTVPWTELGDATLLPDCQQLHYVIVDYGIGGESKAYAQLMEVNKRLPGVTAELVQARDFTYTYKAQLYASERNWMLTHIIGTINWHGHGAWITSDTGHLVAWHGGAGDRGWCAPQDPGVVYTTDPDDPQIASSYRHLRGLAEVLANGSPLDYPSRLFIAEDTCDPREFTRFVKRIKELVKKHDIKIVLKPYDQMILKPSGCQSDVFIGLEKDRERHQTILNTERSKMRGEIKGGPKKPLEGLKGDRGCCRRTQR